MVFLMVLGNEIFFGFGDIIADSIETVANAQFYDALVPVVGCDKNMPEL